MKYVILSLAMLVGGFSYSDAFGKTYNLDAQYWLTPNYKICVQGNQNSRLAKAVQESVKAWQVASDHVNAKLTLTYTGSNCQGAYRAYVKNREHEHHIAIGVPGSLYIYKNWDEDLDDQSYLRVIAHEMGHTLGFFHSDARNQTDKEICSSIMYYIAYRGPLEFSEWDLRTLAHNYGGTYKGKIPGQVWSAGCNGSGGDSVAIGGSAGRTHAPEIVDFGRVDLGKSKAQLKVKFDYPNGIKFHGIFLRGAGDHVKVTRNDCEGNYFKDESCTYDLVFDPQANVNLEAEVIVPHGLDGGEKVAAILRGIGGAGGPTTDTLGYSDGPLLRRGDTSGTVEGTPDNGGDSNQGGGQDEGDQEDGNGQDGFQDDGESELVRYSPSAVVTNLSRPGAALGPKDKYSIELRLEDKSTPLKKFKVVLEISHKKDRALKRSAKKSKIVVKRRVPKKGVYTVRALFSTQDGDFAGALDLIDVR